MQPKLTNPITLTAYSLLLRSTSLMFTKLPLWAENLNIFLVMAQT